ncbi:hypothetical protein DTO96_101577 [Ephemeroptericola cinctiostellae]|uniref:Uncharacterized protein n=1 Tax=Ephemeroptericola cinctiostellae TaxID=2268024 RepID=A0A345DBU9_9BURK|nr:energy-coupling factor ABC transporter permease [Ephemeroptericola cinctiostellae]AXF85837.1 hypothetical protein DTO96_101577 [Ephemeroptericola cinctiostellae]
MFILAQPLNFFSSYTWWFINTVVLMVMFVFIFLLFKQKFFSNHKNSSNPHNIWLSTTFSLSIIWLMRAQLLDNLYLHFIGVSLAYLLLDIPLTGLALAVVLIFTNVTRHISFEIWGAQYALSVLFPLLLSYVLHLILARQLPKRVFVFIFIHGFFVTALVMASTVAFNLLVLNYFGIILLDVGNGIFWIGSVLLGWGEAFMTGMIITLVAVYRPQWLQHRVQFQDV